MENNEKKSLFPPHQVLQRNFEHEAIYHALLMTSPDMGNVTLTAKVEEFQENLRTSAKERNVVLTSFANKKVPVQGLWSSLSWLFFKSPAASKGNSIAVTISGVGGVIGELNFGELNKKMKVQSDDPGLKEIITAFGKGNMFKAIFEGRKKRFNEMYAYLTAVNPNIFKDRPLLASLCKIIIETNETQGDAQTIHNPACGVRRFYKYLTRDLCNDSAAKVNVSYTEIPADEAKGVLTRAERSQPSQWETAEECAARDKDYVEHLVALNNTDRMIDGGLMLCRVTVEKDQTLLGSVIFYRVPIMITKDDTYTFFNGSIMQVVGEGPTEELVDLAKTAYLRAPCIDQAERVNPSPA
jgi:hypothetical protein